MEKFESVAILEKTERTSAGCALCRKTVSGGVMMTKNGIVLNFATTSAEIREKFLKNAI